MTGKTKKLQTFFVNVGKNLKKARREAGMSQEELAKKMAYSNGTISKIENGKRRLGIDELVRFANTFNKPVNYFMNCPAAQVRSEGMVVELRRIERLLVPLWDSLRPDRKVVFYSYFEPEYLRGRNVEGFIFNGEPLDDTIKKGDAVYFDSLVKPKEGNYIIGIISNVSYIMQCVKKNGELYYSYVGGVLPFEKVNFQGVVIESRRKYIRN